MTTTQVQKNFGRFVSQATQEPITVTKHTKELFVIVPVDFYHEMQQRAELGENRFKSPKKLSDFIGAGRRYSRFSSIDEVDSFLATNREIWAQ